MHYLPFGRCGLRVSALCLGAGRFGGGDGLNEETGRAVFEAFLDIGGTFVDTATNYNDGRSEKALGPLIAGRRNDLIIASKFSLSRRGDKIASAGASRKSLRLAVERSLKRLGTDYLDILYLHQWDFDTEADEVLQAMGDLVRRGLVDQIALSNVPAWISARCDALAELHGWPRFAGMQIGYALLERSADREVLPMADARGLGVAAWWPLWQGLLSGKHVGEDGQVNADAPIGGRERAIVQATSDVARALGATMSQVALSWLIHRKPAAIIPVVGASSAAQISGNHAAVSLVLDDEHLATLEAVSAVDLGYPYDYLGRASFRDMRTAYQHDRLRSRY